MRESKSETKIRKIVLDFIHCCNKPIIFVSVISIVLVAGLYAWFLNSQGTPGISDDVNTGGIQGHPRIGDNIVNEYFSFSVDGVSVKDHLGYYEDDMINRTPHWNAEDAGYGWKFIILDYSLHNYMKDKSLIFSAKDIEDTQGLRYSVFLPYEPSEGRRPELEVPAGISEFGHFVYKVPIAAVPAKFYYSTNSPKVNEGLIYLNK